jgi:broad specificity phosphatase PhoE
LNEIDNGLIEGQSEVEIRDKYPEVSRGFSEREADFRFPEGETGEEARDRIAAFIEEKRILHEGRDIVAFSHEGLIRLLSCHVLNLPVYKRWNFQVDFCGTMELSFQPDHGEWKIIRFNHTIG